MIEAANITRAGVPVVMQAANPGGDDVPASEHTFLLVRNEGSAPVVVSAQPVLVDVLGNPSLPTPVSVPAGAQKWMGPFPAACYAGPEGLMAVSWSDVTNVQVGAMIVGDWAPMLLAWLLAESGDFLTTEAGDKLVMEAV